MNLENMFKGTAPRLSDAKTAVAGYLGQHPDAAWARPLTPALDEMSAAEQAAGQATKALADGLAVPNLSGPARDLLTQKKIEAGSVNAQAIKALLARNYPEALGAARSAGQGAKSNAKFALGEAARLCDKAAEAEKSSGGGGGGGARHDSSGETELPGTEVKPKGNPQLAKKYSDAAEAIRRIANGL